MLDENNKWAKAFIMARDKFQGATITKLKLLLKSTSKRVGRQRNAPTCNEVAPLIIDDIGINDSSRDIVIEHKRNGLQRIKERHPSFPSLHYSLPFHTVKMNTD